MHQSKPSIAEIVTTAISHASENDYRPTLDDLDMFETAIAEAAAGEGVELTEAETSAAIVEYQCRLFEI